MGLGAQYVYRLGKLLSKEVMVDPLVCCEPNGAWRILRGRWRGNRLTIPTGSNGDARPHAAAVTLTLTRGILVLLLFLKRVRLVVSPSSGKQHKLLPCIFGALFGGNATIAMISFSFEQFHLIFYAARPISWL